MQSPDGTTVSGVDVINAGVAGFFANAGIPYSYSNFNRAHLSNMRGWNLDWDRVYGAQRIHCTDKATFVLHEPSNTIPLFAFSFHLCTHYRHCAITHVERGPHVDATHFNTALVIDCASYIAGMATHVYPAKNPFSVAIKNPLDYMLPHYREVIIKDYNATPRWDETNRLLTIDPPFTLG